MDSISILRLINVIFTFGTVPPASLVVLRLIDDRVNEKIDNKLMNLILIIFFTFVVFSSMYSGFLSLLLILNLRLEESLGFYLSQNIFNLRNIMISFSSFLSSWGVYLLTRHHK